MNIDRIWVVTILESPISVTRVVLASGTAHDFLAWIASKGKTASLRVQNGGPARSEAEQQRAVEYAQQFANETITPQ